MKLLNGPKVRSIRSVLAQILAPFFMPTRAQNTVILVQTGLLAPAARREERETGREGTKRNQIEDVAMAAIGLYGTGNTQLSNFLHSRR